MWFFNKKKQSKYKVNFDEIQNLDDLIEILKVYFENKVFNQQAIEDFPKIIKYLEKINE